MLPLNQRAVARQLPAVKAELGRADQDRLDRVVALIGTDGLIHLGAAVDALYPSQSSDNAQAAFRQFRASLGKAAKDAGVSFALEVDSQKRTAAALRRAWFTGENAVIAEATESAEAETRGVVRSAQEAVTLDAKLTRRYFVSYAHEDDKLAAELLKKLTARFSNTKDFRFSRWHDKDIILGKEWHEQIQQAIAECDFGLLLLSHDFLASPYIREHELPHFLPPNSGKHLVPVVLKAIDFSGRTDLRGLEKLQCFRDSDGRSYAERKGPRCDAFADELFAKIVAMLGMQPTPPEDPDKWHRRLRDHMPPVVAPVGYVASPTRLSTMDKLDADTSADKQRGDALAMLLAWADEVDGPPYCALLGELGMGKTTNAQAFVRELLKRRESDPAARPPIYLDLRLLGDAALDAPNLTNILDILLRRSWKGGAAAPALTADDIVQLVRKQGAVVVFDGLDEVLVHLTPSAGQQFVRELYRILPPNIIHPANKGEKSPDRIGRLLLTCRTHYFPTLRDRQTFLTAEGRDRVIPEDYRVLLLLPFEEAEIRTYLAATLPDTDPDRVLETIRAVHNLSELAARPYTLSLITTMLPRIERWKMEGRAVSSTDLYREMVLSWLERDTGKHQLTPTHKQRLMEQLAAAFWRSGRRDWTVEKLEQWLIDLLLARPDIAGHYEGVNRAVLKEDLRTATFLVDVGEDSFRFAHTSLQEFFLAAHLARALEEGRIEEWDLPRPSRETLDFLGETLLGKPDALAAMRAMLSPYRPRISEMLLAYLLRAAERSYPMIPADGIVLDGADLRGWSIGGGAGHFRLRRASLRRALLDGAQLQRVDLREADFSSATLTRAEILDSQAEAARFDAAALQGTIFRKVDLRRTTWEGARQYRTQWLHCDVEGAGLSLGDDSFAVLCQPEGALPTKLPAGPARLERFAGQSLGVVALCCDPTGRLLATCGYDATIRLWDAVSLAEVAVLRGHSGAVLSVAFSPDGTSLASAGGDGTLRLWRVADGSEIAVLRGHDGSVSSVAFSPDGTSLASAGGDTVLLWRVADGGETAALRGHDGSVRSVAFAPDGCSLVSAGHDSTVRLWRVADGGLIAVLRGHERWVHTVAFSPDGAILASAGGDSTLRLWRVADGSEIAVLRGYGDWILSVAFSPDGACLASAGGDGALRLWRVADGNEIATLRSRERWLNAVAFSPDGALLVTAGDEGTLRLWRVADGGEIAVIRGHEGWVRSVAFSPDGASLASSGGDGTVRLWRAADGGEITVQRGDDGGVSSVVFSPDGTILASANYSGAVWLWRVADGGEIAVLRVHDHWVNSVAFSPDGAVLASAGGDPTVRLWRVADGGEIAALHCHDDGISSMAFSPNGASLASSSIDGTVRLWRVADGGEIAVLRCHDGGVSSVAFSPDGASLVSSGIDGTVRLWRVANGGEIAVLRGHDGGVSSVVFSPDGASLASAGGDGTVRLWRVAGGGEIAVLRGHDGGVSSVAFSPDGASLASAGDDGTVRLWDVATCGVRLIRAHFDAGAWASIDPNSNRILHGDGDAWRWLGWAALRADGRIERYPAETFGALPGPSLPADPIGP